MQVTARIPVVAGLLSFLLSLAVTAGTASVAADIQQRKYSLDGTGQALPKARQAFAASPQVKTKIDELLNAGYVLADEGEAVLVRGGCGIVGCEHQVLVVQRQSTKGADTSTASVIAMVHLSATDKATVKLVELRELEQPSAARGAGQ